MKWEGLTEALARLQRATGGDWSPQEQAYSFASMPLAERDRAVGRLLALEPMVTGGANRRVADLEAELGIKRRNVYVLIDRLRRMPPAEAVAVRSRSGHRRAAVRGVEETRSTLIDRAVLDALAADPASNLATVVRQVQAAARAADISVPAAKTVSRRLDALRRAHGSTGAVGRHILVDEAPVRVAVSHDGRLAAQSLALVLDVDTSLVLGWGMASIGCGYSAIEAALTSFVLWHHRVREIRSVASTLERMEMVLPPGLRIGPRQDFDEPVRLLRGGSRTSGVRMRRLVGAAISGIALLPRFDRDREWLASDETEGWVVLDRKTMPLVMNQQLMSPIRSAEVTMLSGEAERPDALDESVEAIAQVRPLLKAARPFPGL
ncbi:hypothetical protein LPN01_15225 [Sphingomonas sp. A2-49]|uniref:hypothetical protein n=1 Tax=Sphingomonas sp. A2-49 TaxID=1391375 RepID=UPI0021D3440A|nr:hypothetical protein [Sphingomonas sp. A2-49]MCU6455432.1 hypothetical protein [Sphingomonas sp. A2-49]